MSLDSTCRGLFTARLGPFMMELHKGIQTANVSGIMGDHYKLPNYASLANNPIPHL